MPLEKFERWAVRLHLQQTFPLSPTLQDATIGIDASFYLDLALRNNQEYLVHAHGGLPFTVARELEDDLKALQAANIRPIFVFSGLNHLTKTPSASQSNESTRAVDNGFVKIRNNDAASKIADEFSKATYPVHLLHAHLQHLLQKHNVEFLVAPYSATAQLAYMLNSPQQWIDCIMGSLECFLFGVDKVITKLSHGKDVPNPSFDFITRASCEERLKVNLDTLRDAQLLLGTSFSLPFPPLEAPAQNKSLSIQDAINMLNGHQRSVLNLCKVYHNDTAVSDLDYADRYKKAIMTIRHHIVLESIGHVTPLDFEHAPGDVHEFVGQNLPEELFFYISRGLLAPNIPNWLTQGEIVLSLPSGVRDSEPYRRLVVEQLNPIRALALKVLAEQLNFYYQRRTISIRAWDGRNTDNLTIALGDEPELKAKMACWTVRGAELASSVGKSSAGTLLSCLTALKDKSFAKRTAERPKFSKPTFHSKEEIVVNTSFRFLQLRGYLNDNHEVTKWGQVLEATLDSLETKDDAEGQALLAVELLRLGLLNGNEADGTNIPPADKDHRHKVNANLISKVACLGKYQNKYGVGYYGPLDRSVLAFAWTVTSLRTTLRDLMQSIMTAMFLSGEVERERNDWGELVASLPLLADHGAPLGIMAKTYLDALKDDGEITPELISKIKLLEKPYDYFGELRKDSLTKSLANAWKVWDATFEGVKRSDIKEKKMFAEADAWLEPRR